MPQITAVRSSMSFTISVLASLISKLPRFGRGVVIAALLLMLSGCAAIPVRRLEPASLAASANSCTNNPALRIAISRSDNGTQKFAFLVPPSVAALPESIDLPKRANSKSVPKTAGSYAEYRSQVEKSKVYLPEQIRDDVVTNAFVGMMTKISASAQVDAAVSLGILSQEEGTSQQEIIRKAPVATKLTHRQLKSFADKFFDYQLRPSLANVDTSVVVENGQLKKSDKSSGKINTFATYFKAYYEGKFVSRLGQTISKPDISLTIPDSEIAAAETVLLEFLIDLVDATPVLGNDDDPDKATTFYPGGSNKPTALTTEPKLARYQKIRDPGAGVCGVTTANIQYLVDLANGASDRAATIGGLVANTPGGLSIGLGVLGKISIGDNQTLSTLAKTAASELAARATFTASYFALEHVKIPVNPPASP
jgi:hypothetical protein